MQVDQASAADHGGFDIIQHVMGITYDSSDESDQDEVVPEDQAAPPSPAGPALAPHPLACDEAHESDVSADEDASHSEDDMFEEEADVTVFNGMGWEGHVPCPKVHHTPAFDVNLLPPRASTGARLQLHVPRSCWQAWYEMCPSKKTLANKCKCFGAYHALSRTFNFSDTGEFGDQESAERAAIEWLRTMDAVHTST